jgi:hypothetical protein
MGTENEMDWGGISPTINTLKLGSTRPGMAGTEVTATAAELNVLDVSVAGKVVGSMPTAVQQAINANGAISVVTYYTAITSVTTTGVTYTLAAGTTIGQLKKMQLIVDGGSDAVVTFNTNATITFADAGDVAVLVWTGSAWSPVELSNDADGATAPAYVAAS